MVYCEFALLMEVHDKVTLLMECLKISPGDDQATPSQDGILSSIIIQLEKTLEYLLVRDSHQQSEGQLAGYPQIQQELQRQQQLNRNLIRRELQFKEYQKCVVDELAQEKKTVKGLQEQLIKANQRALAKDMEIVKMNTEKKMSKDKKAKDIIAIQSIFTERKLGDPFKSLKEGGFTLHRRGNSDDLGKRTSTTNMKKKGSIVKK